MALRQWTAWIGSDFGVLGGHPIHPKLLDWLASEFVAQKYSMKWLHKLIVTSETPGVLRQGGRARSHQSPFRSEQSNALKFPLRRLEAEAIRDAMLLLAGQLDLTLGGKSFDAVKTETLQTGAPRICREATSLTWTRCRLSADI
jgi:hypothetical protein